MGLNAHQGNWTTDTVAGHSCEIYSSPRPNEHGYVVLYLHHADGAILRDQPVSMQQLDERGLNAICPVTGPSWWLDRVCPEFDPGISAQKHVVSSVLPWIERTFGCRPPRIALWGHGMGGQGALRLAYKFPDLFPVVAAVSPAIDFQLLWNEGDPALTRLYATAEAARQDTAILHIHPLNWPRHQYFCCDPADDRWWDGADRLRMKLSSIGIPHECDLETSTGGDQAAYAAVAAPRVVSFLYQRLERERLRIV